MDERPLTDRERQILEVLLDTGFPEAARIRTEKVPEQECGRQPDREERLGVRRSDLEMTAQHFDLEEFFLDLTSPTTNPTTQGAPR